MMTAHTWGNPTNTTYDYVTVSKELAAKFPGQFVSTITKWTRVCTNCSAEMTSYAENGPAFFCQFPDCESYEATKTQP